ncbi:MAG TPA: ATP-binding protein [Anaerolineales bacterium]|nr:ATP-binding protein [Anaerolineales bacterium]
MKQFNTLRVRFALWTSALVLTVLFIFGVYVYGSMARGLSAAIDNSLTINASQVAAGLNIENGKLILPENLIEDPENSDLRGLGLTIRILNPQGTPLQEFGPYHGLPVSLTQSFSNFTDPTSETTVRIYNQPVYDNNQMVAIVQIAQSLDEVQGTLQKLLVTLLVSIPILVSIAGISGYFLASRALSPIDQITATARQISAKDLSARLNISSTDDEVGRLTQTLNDMLARLDDSFQRERQFTNDASHELRTPLTAMQAILGVIREKQRTPDEYEQALDDLNEEADRLRTLVENLMHLARGEKRSDNLYETVNLATLINDVADSLRPLVEAKQLTLNCEVTDNLAVLGDSDELIRIFVNLLDNAIKYTEQGQIDVIAKKDAKEILVSVKDTGVGISPEHLPHIFDRFYRVDKSRSRQAGGGSGIGLTIAHAIVEAHGGRIWVESAGDGQGSTFNFTLPVSE